MNQQITRLSSAVIAIAAAMVPPGQIATLILPGDTAWNEHPHQFCFRHLGRAFAQHQIHQSIHIGQVAAVVEVA